MSEILFWTVLRKSYQTENKRKSLFVLTVEFKIYIYFSTQSVKGANYECIFPKKINYHNFGYKLIKADSVHVNLNWWPFRWSSEGLNLTAPRGWAWQWRKFVFSNDFEDKVTDMFPLRHTVYIILCFFQKLHLS